MTIYALIALAVVFLVAGTGLVISGLRLSGEDAVAIESAKFPEPVPVILPKPSVDLNVYEGLKFQLEEREAQLEKSQKSVDSINQEYQQLQSQVDQDRGKLKQLQENIEQLKSGLELSTTKEHAKLHVLEEEVQRLADENQRLLAEKNLANKLRIENENLQRQIEGNDSKLHDFLKSMEDAKAANEKKLEQAQKLIGELQKKEGHYLAQLEHQKNDPQLAETREKLSSAEREAERLLSENAGLVLNISKYKEFNAHLLEKEKMLQYELTKSRAQAIGLETVCQDFKIQIDQLSKFKQAVHES